MTLSVQEFELLAKRFGLQTEEFKAKQHCVDAHTLLNKDICREVLRQLSLCLGHVSLKVTASMLSKRIAFLTTASSFYAFSVYNKALDFSLDNCYIDYNHHEGLWVSQMPLKDVSILQPCTKEERFALRKQLVQRVFAQHLNPLWQVLSDVADISLVILWENTANRVYSLYENKITQDDKALNNFIYEDFEYLISQASSELFGWEHNPLQYFYNTKQVDILEKKKRKRKSCCFYYKTINKKRYCENCPIKL